MKKFYVIIDIERFLKEEKYSLPYNYGYDTAEEAYNTVSQYLKEDCDEFKICSKNEANSETNLLTLSYNRFKKQSNLHFFKCSRYYVQEIFIKEDNDEAVIEKEMLASL